MLVLVLAGSSWAAPTAEQKAEIAAVGELLKKAGALFNEKKYAECGAVIREVQEKVAALSDTGDKVILRQLETPHKQLSKAHALLELEGVELPELMPLAKPKRPEKPVKPDKPSPSSPATDGLSFIRHVAPLLIAKCGRCHVQDTKGEFSAASYAALMKGAGQAGKVVFPGDATGSRIIEVIESGDMPRGGNKLTPDEFEMLKKWINDGAKFDGPDQNASIARLVPATSTAAPATPAAPQIVEATGKETVSFSNDIASTLAQSCTGCHGNNNPRAQFSLANFAALMKGSENGPVLTPGEGAKSLIVMKLKGTASGMRMPANQAPLADTFIAKIEKWIDEGAKFDGPDGATPLAQVALIAKAAGSTHEELTAERIKIADQTWNTSMPGIQHDAVESENFYALGTISDSQLKELLDRAEQQTLPKIATILGAPTDKPLIKGRFTLFVVKVRYDFSEIGKVLLNVNTVSPQATGIWRYNGIDAAGVLLAPKQETDYSVDGIVAEQATALYLSSTGRSVPRWFAEGVGRVVASRVTSGDGRVRQWDTNLGTVFASLSSPDAFMTTKFDPESSAIASYSFARFLMTEPRKFNNLLDGLRKGGKFDDVFVASYGASPKTLAEVWYRKGPGKLPRPTRPPANKSAKSE